MEKVSLKECLELDNLNQALIVFPTDTVYGLGCVYNDYDTLERIYKLKERDGRKPIAVLVADTTQANEYFGPFSEHIQEIMRTYWPGGLTIIVPYKDTTLGIRMPNSIIAQSILKKFGPLATTSVNHSGEAELNSVEEIEKTFPQGIDYIVTDKATFSSVPSTVIKINQDDTITVLRQGQIIIK